MFWACSAITWIVDHKVNEGCELDMEAEVEHLIVFDC
jgi:hypothetical protein